MRDLTPHQEVRDDAEHLSARVEHRVGENAHQADAATAIDQPDSGLGEAAAQRLGSVREHWATAALGATKHRNGMNGCHRTSLYSRLRWTVSRPRRLVMDRRGLGQWQPLCRIGEGT